MMLATALPCYPNCYRTTLARGQMGSPAPHYRGCLSCVRWNRDGMRKSPLEWGCHGALEEYSSETYHQFMVARPRTITPYNTCLSRLAPERSEPTRPGNSCRENEMRINSSRRILVAAAICLIGTIPWLIAIDVSQPQSALKFKTGDRVAAPFGAQ